MQGARERRAIYLDAHGSPLYQEATPMLTRRDPSQNSGGLRPYGPMPSTLEDRIYETISSL